MIKNRGSKISLDCPFKILDLYKGNKQNLRTENDIMGYDLDLCRNLPTRLLSECWLGSFQREVFYGVKFTI